MRSLEKEITPQPLENEINNIISKEANWIRFKTEKLEPSQHDSIKKFRTELLREQMTIDINQLKLDMNLDAHLKNRVINNSSKQGTMQDQKQGQTIKSATQNSADGASNKNIQLNVFIFSNYGQLTNFYRRFHFSTVTKLLPRPVQLGSKNPKAPKAPKGRNWGRRMSHHPNPAQIRLRS